MLGKTDLKILAELDRDARISIASLAKKLRLNRDKVKYRIAKLEEQEVIDEYYALIDYSKLGYTMVRLYLELMNTTEDVEKQIIDFFLKSNNVLKVYETEVKWNLAIGILVKTFDEYTEMYQEFKSKFGEYIYQAFPTVLYEYVHFHKKYLTSSKKQEKGMSVGNNKEIIVENPELLKYISDKARTPLIEIAKYFKVAPNTIKYQLKKLEKDGVILAYRAKINHDKIGYEYYKIDIELEDTSIISSLRQFCRMHSNVIFEDRTISGSDFEFNIEVKNYDDLLEIISQLKKTFPKKIRRWSYYKNKKAHKFRYVIAH